MGTVSTSLPSDGTTIDASDVNTPINAILSEFNGNIDDNNIKSGANINGSKILAASLSGSKLDSTTAGGWIASGLPAVSSVTENGNRSADITFASTVASILTPGMRLRTSRTVAAPTYMGGAFNGTNHYFTKTTATSTLSTLADNFTLMAHIEPTAYQTAVIMGRSSSAPATGFFLQMNSSGQIVIGIRGATSGDYRFFTTYQSVPLNKKTHVAASWASGTVVVYFDGISVPVGTATTAGTAPTSASTGGDFSVGREGAYNGQYFAGYISGVGVFNAVLSASTIRSYKNQVLSGSETNCIGAWSLNNTAVNQQAAGTNDLTATNSVGYTARSPYCTDANGTASGTYDWAIVQKVATTVATVQYPEGCAIPTSGGISTVDYSGVKAPFGMPVSQGRWDVGILILSNVSTSGLTANTVYNPGGLNINVPVGEWNLKKEIGVGVTTSGGVSIDFYSSLSTSSSSATIYDFSERTTISIGSTNSHIFSHNKTAKIALTTATPYYILLLHTTALSAFNVRGDSSNNLREMSTVKAELAYL